MSETPGAEWVDVQDRTPDVLLGWDASVPVDVVNDERAGVARFKPANSIFVEDGDEIWWMTHWTDGDGFELDWTPTHWKPRAAG